MTYQSNSGPIAGSAPGARAYRSSLRERQAAETRLRVVAAAATLFTELGYTRTTLARVALAAEVSVETVQAQGSKAALMIASVEFAAFGHTGDVSILDLDVGQRFVALDERDDAIDFFAAEQTSVHERSALITRALFGAAANDPELDRYLGELLAGVGRQIRRLLEVCAERGWLRDDVEFEELVGTTVVLAGVDTYLRLVHREGWTAQAYRDWLGRTLRESVFAHGLATRPRRGRQR